MELAAANSTSSPDLGQINGPFGLVIVLLCILQHVEPIGLLLAEPPHLQLKEISQRHRAG